MDSNVREAKTIRLGKRTNWLREPTQTTATYGTSMQFSPLTSASERWSLVVNRLAAGGEATVEFSRTAAISLSMTLRNFGICCVAHARSSVRAWGPSVMNVSRYHAIRETWASSILSQSSSPPRFFLTDSRLANSASKRSCSVRGPCVDVQFNPKALVHRKCDIQVSSERPAREPRDAVVATARGGGTTVLRSGLAQHPEELSKNRAYSRSRSRRRRKVTRWLLRLTCASQPRSYQFLAGTFPSIVPFHQYS